MVSLYLSKKTSLNDFSSSALIMRLGLLRYENKTRIPAYDEFIGQMCMFFSTIHSMVISFKKIF